MRGIAERLTAVMLIIFLSIFSPSLIYASHHTIITESTWVLLAKKVNPAVVLIEADAPHKDSTNVPASREKRRSEREPRLRNSNVGLTGFLRYPVLIIERWNPQLKKISHMRLGTGSIIHPHGYVITNNHVVENATQITITMHDNTKYSADIISTEPLLDAALLKIKSPASTTFPFLPIAPSPALERGTWVFGIGHPYGLPFRAFQSIVSSPPPENSLNLPIDTKIVFLLAGTFPPGSSGAPLVDLKGQAIGMVFAAVGEVYFPGFALMFKPIITHFRNNNFLPPLPKP